MTGGAFRATLLLPTGVYGGGYPRPPQPIFAKFIPQVSRTRDNVMASILLPLGIRVAVEFNLNGKVVVNIYHVTTTDPIVTVKLVDIAQVFVAWWDTYLSVNMSDEIALFQVTALDMSVPNGEKITVVVSPEVPGLLVQSVLSNNVAAVVTLKTAKTGRSFQGRAYLAGLSELEVVGNTIIAARVTVILSHFPELVSSLGTNAAKLVVASFQSGGVPRETGVATEVDAFSMNDRVDTQRRRLPKS